MRTTRRGLGAVLVALAGVALVLPAAPRGGSPPVVTAATDPLFAATAAGPGALVRVVVTLDRDVPDVAAAARGALPAGAAVGRTWTHVGRGFSARLPAAAVPALRRAPGVVRVEPDVVVRAMTVQPSPPRGLDRIDQRSLPLSASYAFTRTGLGVTAYVVDTGIRRSHQDFTGRARTGFDAVTAGGAAEDCNGHGTHVAGTVGGARYGVAKAVTLAAVRVLDCDGSGFGSDLIAGLDYVVRDHDPGEPAVAVMSLGGSTSRALDDAVRAVIADGVTAAVASGNESTDACLVSPARVAAALTISATDPSDDRRPSFANFGQCVDLFAPGVEILSASAESDVATAIASGTSMAAPHVAGAAALVLETDPGATPADVASALLADATRDVVVDARSATDDLLHAPEQSQLGAVPLPSVSRDPVTTMTDEPRDLYVPVTPQRLLDTRDEGARVPPNAPRAVQVAGRGGVPPLGVSAVALNVTAVDPGSDGHVVVYPAGAPVPPSSNLNHPARATVANLAVSGVSDDGRVALLSSGGSPHLLVDVIGYWTAGTSGNRSTALAPTRLLDTRSTGSRLPEGGARRVPVTGRGGVPPAGVAVVAVNVTAVGARAGGHLTVHPSGEPPPLASNVNYAAGQVVANLVLAEVGADGAIDVLSSRGSPHLLVDVVGWYGAEAGDRFADVFPDRLLDTREGIGGAAGRLVDGRPITVRVGGRAGVPGVGVTAALLNVTVIGATASGHLTVFPTGTTPRTSTVNYDAGRTVANLVLARVSPSGDQELEVAIVASRGSPHVVVDVVGWTGP